MDSKKGQKTKQKKVSIGGQAVLEGIMMRGKTSMATAVRDPDGIIRLETKRVKTPQSRSIFFRLPIIRGVCSFIQSMFGGTAVLMRSAEVYGQGEPTKFEKWVSKKLKVDVISVVGFISILLGLALAIFLFMWLPQVTRGLIERAVGGGFSFNVWAKNFIEGGIKLLIFLGYILLCTLIKDVRRTFMYHGAEHKTISCYEKGLDLTVENVKKCSRVHDRCGTTFMVFVILISILAFACFESLVGQSLNGIVRILCKIMLLPVVAGLSYELLKCLAKTQNKIFFPLKAPGLLLQKVTTREPDDKMIEVAILAFNQVVLMDGDQAIKEVQFVLPTKISQVTKSVYESLLESGIQEKSESEWIVSLTLKVKRDQVYGEQIVLPKQIDKIFELVKKRKSGMPLWYCVGDTEFYGYTIKTDSRALIPRPETEILVEKALEFINKDTTVLDLCTGSGAIAVAVQKQSGAKVTASDFSEKALSLAKENAELNGADIEFIYSDMFNSLADRKFNIIITNPPYVRSQDIDSLQSEIKNFEPIMALDGGKDGLDFYRIIAKESITHLFNGGVLLMEIGYDQKEQVVNLLQGFSNIEVIKDYDNNDRIIKAVFNV